MILAVGASAAEIGSLVRVLTELPSNAGLAVVLALQNREALDESGFRRALGERAGALVATADGMLVEAGRIYLPGPNVILTVEEGRFRTRSAEQAPGGRGTIDSFFISLAQAWDGKTIGLILAGTGGDGTLGVTAIKEAGGLTLAEETADSEAGHLAVSNGPAALADLVLQAGEIPARVALQARHLVRREDALAAEEQASDLSEALARIAAILRDKTGHDFHGYKRNTFLRRVQRRMQVAEVDGIGSYVDVLRTRPDEAQLLFNDLLIGVTQFFRDRREFELLETHVIPRLFEGKGQNDQVRVWVLGCSTGEEAYSIAILLCEFAATLDAPPHLQIFATDIDGRALAAARVGRYPLTIAKDMTPERLARWFVKEGNTYCVVRELREICIFSQHSIVRDTPFSRLDLVSCRNLLIYLGADLQNRVIPLFHFALRPGGFLFLGNSENVSQHAKLFAPVDRGFRIFQKIETERRPLPDFPFSTTDARSPAFHHVPRDPRPAEHDLVRRAERLAERYAPAYAIVNGQFEVLHFSARVGRFIQPAGGAASLNLLNLVHGDLRLDLRGALSKAEEEKRTARADGIHVGLNGQRMVVDLVVEPLQASPDSPRNFVVLFKDGAALPDLGDDEMPAEPALREERVRRLDAELRVTRERLQATIEELESTNEELKASNEEYQSLNEELQSANEELATSKEELQSVNEELTTVNSELAHRIEELGRANSDLKNLLESTQIATVFLDNELRVTNFTPAVAEIFHLVEGDIGRPIAHIKSRVAYDELQDDVRRVARTLGTVEREVENPATRARYMARVLPYRSVDNFVAGTVLTFADVTPLTRAERALRESEERLRLVTERIPQLVWTAADEGKWTWTSGQWSEYTGQTEAESLGRGWLGAVHPDDRADAVSAWEAAAASGVLDTEYRVRAAANGAYRWFHSRATPLAREGGEGAVEWFGTSTDVHEMRELRDRQAVMVAELQHRTRNLIAVVRALADRTIASSATLDEFREQFGDRLLALSRVQGLLSRRTEGARVAFDELLRAELSAHAALDDGGGEGGNGEQKVVLDGPAGVQLRSGTVQTFALALHELATNAVKHGALSMPTGRLQVRWRVESGSGNGGKDGDARPRLRVEWHESGVAALEGDEGPRNTGYGRELIERGLPYQLGAETRYELGRDGVRCSISVPIAAGPMPGGKPDD